MNDPLDALDAFDTHGSACTEQSGLDFEEVLCRAAAHHPGMNVHDPIGAIDMLNTAADARDPGLLHRIPAPGWCIDPFSGIRWHEGWAL